MMKKIVFLLIFPVFLQAQKKYPALLDQYMQAAVNANQFSGSVLIAKHGNIIYRRTFGTIDYANAKPLDSNSMFEVGNITEEFTAAAILLLKNEGKLRLADPITKYLPELPYSNVTIINLLTHTAGLPDYYDEVMKDKWGAGKLATNNDVVKSLADAKVPLAWPPGTKIDDYHYYTDYPLLASIIERISGLSYSDFMQQNIFTPLHLDHTKVFAELQVNKKLHPNHTESVYFDEERQEFFPVDSMRQMPPEYHYAVEGVVGNEGVSSTAYDLFLWDKALQNNALFPQAVKNEMFTPYTLKDTVNKYYLGYGIIKGKNELGNYVQQRGDGNIILGYVTILMKYLKEDITIIVLANKAKSSSGIAGPLAYILFDKEVVPPYTHKEVAIDSSLLDKYTGEYALPTLVNIYKKDGTLWTTMPGEPDLQLIPESNIKFFSANKNYDWQMEFKTNPGDKIVKAYVIINGLKKEVKKF